MKKQFTIFIFIFIIGCGFGPDYKEVMVNKTVKVYSKEYHNQAEDYTFKWKPPIGPNNKKIRFDLKNDMLIFTPKKEGNYEIHLSIEDISEEVVEQGVFYFRAVAETVIVAIATAKQEEMLTSPAKTVIKPEENIKKYSKEDTDRAKAVGKEKIKSKTKMQLSNVEYAIQISAWPSIEEAHQEQLRLLDAGFDAYTQRYYLTVKDEIWYRVRVGNFSDRNTAEEIKNNIEGLTGILAWLDIISSK